MLGRFHEPDKSNGKTMKETPLSAPGTQPQSSRLAFASLVFGIIAVALAVFCIGLLFAIPAIICGHMAFARIKRSGGQLTGRGTAIAGLITGYVGATLVAIILPFAIPGFLRSFNRGLHTNCDINLRMIAMAKQQWGRDNQKADGDTPTAADLDKYFNEGFASLRCYKGGHYAINSLGVKPTCSFSGHELKAVESPP